MTTLIHHADVSKCSITSHRKLQNDTNAKSSFSKSTILQSLSRSFSIYLPTSQRHLKGTILSIYRVEMGGVRIGISVFVFFIWLPISLYLFVLPYQIMLGGEGSPLIFYILSLVTFVWFFIWSIADFADANGFVMVSKHFKQERGAAGVFGLITAIMMMLISFLAVINAIFFHRRD